jgi:hypothetical protein
MIAHQFEPFADRIAVGLVGPGSECLGFDDELSRDHDWGPAFCMWLTDDDFAQIGGQLQFAYAQLPESFRGYGPRTASPGEEWRVGTSRISSFYDRFTGLRHLPQTNGQWLRIPESSLAACTSGQVFHDPLGEFSRWRQGLLAYYPEDVRLGRIASLCVTVAQAGQYNYPRSVCRGDRFAASYSLVRFCLDAMLVVFLLNRRYAPFHKWLHRAVGELPILGRETHDHVESLLSGSADSGQPEAIERFVALLIAELQRQGLTDASSDFLLNHAPCVRQRIHDPSLRVHSAAAV